MANRSGTPKVPLFFMARRQAGHDGALPLFLWQDADHDGALLLFLLFKDTRARCTELRHKVGNTTQGMQIS